MITSTTRAAVRPSRSRLGRRFEGLLAGLLLCLAFPLSGCTTADEGHDSRLDVVVSFYPLQFLAERIGGGDVVVENLTPPGSSSHHLELSPQQVARVGEADLVVYQSGFQAATDDAVDTQQPQRTVDAAAAAKIRDRDPHVWLDLDRYQAIAEEITGQLGDADPDHADAYRSRLSKLTAELDRLDADYRKELAPCRGATLVTAHTAFGYLADRYGLEQAGIAGIDPEVEPSPARLREVSEVVEANDVSTIYFEVLTDPRVAKTLADDLGVRTDILDPIENIDPDRDYLTAMRTNLESLRSGLTCR